MALETYILAPNFAFGPDGPIRIGNIIADPFYPTKFLSRPANFPPTPTSSTLTVLSLKTATSHSEDVFGHGFYRTQLETSAAK
ncbi:hypothetical protein V8C42DRAFT_307201 [Trichoderma barbatum]